MAKPRQTAQVRRDQSFKGRQFTTKVILWVEQTEGAKFWLRIVNELRNRGVNDILIAVVDGLKGFLEAINAAFRQTQVQTCIVHYAAPRIMPTDAWEPAPEAVIAAMGPA